MEPLENLLVEERVRHGALCKKIDKIIDRVNELSEMASNPFYTVSDDFKWEGKIEPGSIRKLVPTKRFKAEGLAVGGKNIFFIDGFKSEAEAQAALEQLTT